MTTFDKREEAFEKKFAMDEELKFRAEARRNKLLAQWVAEKGQSLYHICLEVEDIEGALAELKGKGVALLDEVPREGHGGCKIAFLDPRSTGNILIELAEIPAGH